MKRNFIYISIGITILSFGCKDFLTETNPSNQTIDKFYTKAEDVTSGVNATYDALKSTVGGGGYGGAPWMMLEFQTGLAHTDLGQAVDNYMVLNLANTSDNKMSAGYWTGYYKGIANANLVIENAPKVKMDEAVKKSKLGEAYFLRALYYYYLVRIFGHIPLIVNSVSLQSPQLFSKQAAPEDVYNQIVADLKLAEDAGLPFTDPSGGASTGAAKSLLADVYLTMAGYPLQKGAEYYKLAADKAKEVIDAGQYSLFASYADLHDPAKKNTGENIFMVQYKALIQPFNLQSGIIPYNKGISKYSDQTGSISANTDFARSYELDDLRGKEKQFFFTTYTTDKDRSKVIPLGGYFLYKFFDSLANVSTASSELNWSMMRYPLVLLDYAEASNEASGPSQAALDAVNGIRKRAQLAPLSLSISKDEFRTAIWKERVYELCFESVVWFDFVRWHKAFNVGTKSFDEYVGHKFSYGPVLTERELLFPIPTDEIRNNKNLVQNKGY